MIDLEKKIIFTHPQKCGGTTIEGAFSWHPNHAPSKNSKYIEYFKKFKHANLTDHITHIESLGYSEKDFFKVSCIRNPWDLIVSWYYFDKHHKVSAANGSFEEYIERVFSNRNPLDMQPFFYHKGVYYIDYVVKFENYKKDTETLFKKYNVKPKENYNTISRPKNTPYQSVHTNVTKDIVYQNAKHVIDFFGYAF